MPSSLQTLPLIQVFDYLIGPDNKPAANKQIFVRLSVTDANSTAPVAQLAAETVYPAVTDPNGYWTVSVEPNTKINPANTLYDYIDPYKSFQITVSDVGVPVGGWQATNIRVNAPTSLAAAGQVVGPLTVSNLVAGQVVFPGAGGLLSGDTALVWDNVNKRLGIGLANPASTLNVVGNVGIGDTNLAQFAGVREKLRLYAAAGPFLSLTDATNGMGIGTDGSGNMLFVQGSTNVIKAQLNSAGAVFTVNNIAAAGTSLMRTQSANGASDTAAFSLFKGGVVEWQWRIAPGVGVGDLQLLNGSGVVPLSVTTSYHLVASGNLPTLGALQAGVASQSITGNDTRAVLAITTAGAGPPAANSALALVTFGSAFAITPVGLVTPVSFGVLPIFGSPTTSGWTLYQGNAALAISTTYTVNVGVIG